MKEPDINYLAKDYASFRQIMFDRISQLVPEWKERNPADIGVALVELVAYAGDYLSYKQDAIATEAYINTARRRISVRRHARLVDYFMHNGCNSRVLVQIQVSADNVPIEEKTRLLTCVEGKNTLLSLDDHNQVLSLKPEIFETMYEATLFEEHNKMFFYTWGKHEFCLPKGSTNTTLDGNFKNLKVGDILVFVETKNPFTGNSDEADTEYRHAVRLTGVKILNKLLADDIPICSSNNSGYVTKIYWDKEDALPFPLLVSVKDLEHKGDYIRNISVALGNIVLADHGCTVDEKSNEYLGLQNLTLLDSSRLKLDLNEKMLTFSEPYTNNDSINKLMCQDPEKAVPTITLKQSDGIPWGPKYDLLDSDSQDREFVVEIESDGTAYLRFGDGKNGQMPESGIVFDAIYRVGNGFQGNVGVDAIKHIVSDNEHIIKVSNPMSAQGGIEPENIDDVRQKAPVAFRTQERAVTPEDYTAIAERHPEVQKAVATFRMMGNWLTVFITVDRVGGLEVNDDFKEKIRAFLEPYRMIGHDIEIDSPRFVALGLEILVCVKTEYFRNDVKDSLLQVFSNRDLPMGQRGMFHPDNLSFGQTIHLSSLYAASYSVEGVESVQIKKFQPLCSTKNEASNGNDLKDLSMERLEIPILDNDSNIPKNGILRITMEGGK